MKRNELLRHLRNIQNEDYKTVKKKNSDYADGEDPFQNFTLVEKAGLCSTETGFLVRMSDKMQRLMNLLGDPDREAQVEDEDIQDTLSDLRNYCSLLELYLREEDNDLANIVTDVELESISLNTGEEDERPDPSSNEGDWFSEDVIVTATVSEEELEEWSESEYEPVNEESLGSGEISNYFEAATEELARHYNTTPAEIERYCRDQPDMYTLRQRIVDLMIDSRRGNLQ